MTGKSVAPRVHPGVWTHPKTLEVARRTGIAPERVVYHLTRMWSSVLRRRTGGLVFTGTSDTTTMTALQADFARDVDVARPATFLGALIEAKLIDQDGAQFWVHDWTDWQGGRNHRSPTDYYSGEHERETTTPLPELDSGPVSGSGTGPDCSTGEMYRQDRYSGGGVGGGGGRGVSARITTGEGPTSSSGFTRFMWWISHGFVGGEYGKDKYDPAHLTKLTTDDMSLVAECYIAIHRELFGDDYDRRNLTARHALKKVGAFEMFKRRKRVHGTIIELTPEGALRHPSAQSGGAGVAGNDVGTVARTGRQTYPTASGPRSQHVELSPKARERRARQAQGHPIPEPDCAF